MRMDHDSDYYLQRAEVELTAARSARHPAAMRAHYFLAGFYLDKAHGPVGAPAPRARRAVRRREEPEGL